MWMFDLHSATSLAEAGSFYTDFYFFTTRNLIHIELSHIACNQIKLSAFRKLPSAQLGSVSDCNIMFTVN